MKFKISNCSVCGGVDGSIQVIKSYNSKRDESEWLKEGRTIREIEVKEGERFPNWCQGHEDEGDEE